MADSVNTSEATSTTPENAGPNATDPEAIQRAHRWADLRLAHEAMMLNDANKVLADGRAQQQAHSMNYAGPNYIPPGPNDDMIHVGNTTQNHFHQPAEPQPPATTQSSTGSFLRSMAGPALIAAGAGTGLAGAGALIANALEQQPPAVVQPAEPTPEIPAPIVPAPPLDTVNGLRFGLPDDDE